MASKPTKKELLAKKDSYLVINFAYNDDYVFPYDDGIKFMESLVNVEKLDHTKFGYDNETIIPMTKTDYTFKIISQEEYLVMKMAHILGVSPGDITKGENDGPVD